MKMFCYQCEQTARGTGCDIQGVCGKAPDVAALQDIIIEQLKGISMLAAQARQYGSHSERINRYTAEALFTTITNVNFSPERLEQWISDGTQAFAEAVELYKTAAAASSAPVNPDLIAEAERFIRLPAGNSRQEQAEEIRKLHTAADPDIHSPKDLLLFGIKGVAAYADHAAKLGEEDDAIYAFFHEALAAMGSDSSTLEQLKKLVLDCGTIAIRCMEILDKAHTGHYGNPSPTPVSTELKPGPAIIISGHDLLDLEALLEQTAGTGVNVYTHGEMLPAHGYPGLKKYPHFAGHFGTAWQNQQKEFDGIKAAVLFTTNCIQKPRESYFDRVFTCGLVAWPGVKHIAGRDFAPVIEKAKELGGFEAKPGKALLTGCGHHAVLSLADKVISLVKTGKIRRFFVIGGCDGAKPGRNYYTDLADSIPADCVIITLACGKFRFNDHEFGTIDGIPRLLDAGQCNDAFSVITIAAALAKAFNCGLNDLPVSIILSWYEQKAVAVLLALLSLGIKGIKIGPSLPAFVSPNVLNLLVNEFAIKPISTVQEDLQESLK